VVQTRSYDNKKVLAVVIRTGFSTSKGDLIRSILFPKPMGFKFYKDSLKFICFLFLVAAVGTGYAITIMLIKGVKPFDLAMRALDIITIVVPPALPAAMTVGTVYAQTRLKSKLIYCISPPRINICGKLKLICFDKTGTLTEDGLDIWGAIESGTNKSTNNIEFEHPVHHVTHLDTNNDLFKSLTCCHSLSRYDGGITGDPLDIKMFEATQWVIFFI
jgi:cation-transporting P-type ATPase 13A2